MAIVPRVGGAGAITAGMSVSSPFQRCAHYSLNIEKIIILPTRTVKAGSYDV